MRSEWVPLSASALVTGAVALLMAQFLSPTGGGDAGLAESMRLASENAGQWIAMSMLWALSSVCFILGVPSVLTLFPRRGKVLGWTGGVVFAIGAVGLSGLAAMAMIFRAMADSGIAVADIQAALDQPEIRVLLLIWIFGMFIGWVLMAIGLLRARTVPAWIPVLLLVFVVLAWLLEGVYLAERASWIALAAAFTGMAIYAVDPSRHKPARAES